MQYKIDNLHDVPFIALEAVSANNSMWNCFELCCVGSTATHLLVIGVQRCSCSPPAYSTPHWRVNGANEGDEYHHPCNAKQPDILRETKGEVRA